MGLSFRPASALVNENGRVSCGLSRMTSRLPSTRIAGPVPFTITMPFLMTVKLLSQARVRVRWLSAALVRFRYS